MAVLIGFRYFYVLCTVSEMDDIINSVEVFVKIETIFFRRFLDESVILYPQTCIHVKKTIFFTDFIRNLTRGSLKVINRLSRIEKRQNFDFNLRHRSAKGLRACKYVVYR